MKNKKFRIISILFILTLLLSTLVSCSDGYERYEENGFEIAYNAEKKDAVLGVYTWNGDINNMDIVIPNTYKDAAVTSLGGYVVNSRGIYFAIEGAPQNFTSSFLIDKNLKNKNDIDNYVKERMEKEDVNYTVEELVFNIKIGSNLKKIGYAHDAEFHMGHIRILESGDAIAYIVSFKIEVDPQNEYFYSDELGRMYSRENNKLVTTFLYHNRDSFPEHSL